MIRPQGYVTVSNANGRVTEFDSVICSHCQRIILVKANTLSRIYLFPQMDGSMKEEPGAGCLKCDKPICLQCCEVGTCVPAEKHFALLEAIARR